MISLLRSLARTRYRAARMHHSSPDNLPRNRQAWHAAATEYVQTVNRVAPDVDTALLEHTLQRCTDLWDNE